VSADKQTTLHRTPNCLVVHLKRFQNASGGKIQTHIRFDEHLDLTQHLSGASIEQHAAYSLYGVLVHVGSSASSGHYYCFAKVLPRHPNCMRRKFCRSPPAMLYPQAL
jgi:ubiquitin carboxyl-terminal hydrolase 36/42